MRKVLEAAEPLSQVLWRAETDGKDFSTPERRAGLERALAEIVGQIGDGKIADYYRREFEQQVFETFKRRAAQSPSRQRSRREPPSGTVPAADRRAAGLRPRPDAGVLRRCGTACWPAGRRAPSGSRRTELGRLLLEARKSPPPWGSFWRPCRSPIPCLTGCATNS